MVRVGRTGFSGAMPNGSPRSSQQTVVAGPAHELALELVKGLDDEQRVLEVPDVVGLGGEGLGPVGNFLHPIRQAVLGLAGRRDDAVAVDARTAGILDQAELDREPVDAGQALLDGGVFAIQRGLADLDRKSVV